MNRYALTTQAATIAALLLPVSASAVESAATASAALAPDVATQGAPERVRALEERVHALEQGSESPNDAIAFSGLIEVEATSVSPEPEDGDGEDLRLSTFEFGVTVQPVDWLEAFASVLYEQDETDLELDIATLTLADARVTPLFLRAGQFYLPFGEYATNLISDPLTLELGETRDTALQIGVEGSQGSIGWLASAYLFDGEQKPSGDDRINWGLQAGLSQEGEEGGWTLGLGYLHDLGDSDTLADITHENWLAAEELALELALEDPNGVPVEIGDRRVGGWTLNASARFGPIDLIAEYLSATDSFATEQLEYKGAGARPSAWNLEAGYGFTVAGYDTRVGLAYQRSAEAIAVELPEERWLLGGSIDLTAGLSLALEWAHDRDYERSAGGSGDTSDTFTARLAFEF